MSDTTKSVDDELMRIVWHALAEQMTHGTNCKDAEHIEQRSCVDFTKKTFDKTIEAITQLFTKQLEEADKRAHSVGFKNGKWAMMRRVNGLWLQLMIDEVGSEKAFAYKDAIEATLTQDTKGGADGTQ